VVSNISEVWAAETVCSVSSPIGITKINLQSLEKAILLSSPSTKI